MTKRIVEILSLRPSVDDEDIACVVFIAYIFAISAMITLGAVALSR